MDRFLDNAARILEGGRSSVQAGIEDSAWTILLHAGGGVEMVAGSEWGLERMAAERGAEMAYRVSVESGQVRVDGVAAGRKFVVQDEGAGKTARLLLAGRAGLLIAA